jgi:hypothetical protein
VPAGTLSRNLSDPCADSNVQHRLVVAPCALALNANRSELSIVMELDNRRCLHSAMAGAYMAPEQGMARSSVPRPTSTHAFRVRDRVAALLAHSRHTAESHISRSSRPSACCRDVRGRSCGLTPRRGTAPIGWCQRRAAVDGVIPARVALSGALRFILFVYWTWPVVVSPRNIGVCPQ